MAIFATILFITFSIFFDGFTILNYSLYAIVVTFCPRKPLQYRYEKILRKLHMIIMCTST
jgi:hypothetical protein